MARKKLIKVRSDTAAGWAAANPVLEVGEPYFVTDTGEFGFGTGVAFLSTPQSIGSSGVSVVHKTADQSNATLVLSDVTDLSFPVLAAATYIFEFDVLTHSVVNTTGLVLAVNGPASPTYVRYASSIIGTSLSVFVGGADAFEDVIVSSAASANATNPVPMRLNGYLVNGVNAGTLQLRMRSEVDLSAATIQRGSWGRLTRVA